MSKQIERWKPKLNDHYWTIDNLNLPFRWTWGNDELDKLKWKQHLVFRTKKQATVVLSTAKRVLYNFERYSPLITGRMR